MVDFAAQRRLMVDGQVRTFDVTDKAVTQAMMSVPREFFVPKALQSLAYGDTPILVGTPAAPRKLLIPMVLARMIQALDIESGQTTLDVAGGTGYSAALLHAMGSQVTTLESSPEMASLARSALDAAGASSVTIVVGPLMEGWSEGAPYDRILVNGAFDDRPTALLRQLRGGGRLICVLGSGRAAQVTLFTRSHDGDLGERVVFDAAVPPLVPFRQSDEFVF